MGECQPKACRLCHLAEADSFGKMIFKGSWMILKAHKPSRVISVCAPVAIACWANALPGVSSLHSTPQLAKGKIPGAYFSL